MTEKETELRERLGLTLDGPPELETVPRDLDARAELEDTD